MKQSCEELGRNSHCGVTGLEASLEGEDTGSIPSPALWVKDLVWLQLQRATAARMGPLPPGRGTPYALGQPKKKREDKERKKERKRIEKARRALPPFQTRPDHTGFGF